MAENCAPYRPSYWPVAQLRFERFDYSSEIPTDVDCFHKMYRKKIFFTIWIVIFGLGICLYTDTDNKPVKSERVLSHDTDRIKQYTQEERLALIDAYLTICKIEKLDCRWSKEHEWKE